MSSPVIIDTNVLVAGIMAPDRAPPEVLIFDAMAAGRLAFVLSDALLAEYREVLLRPGPRRRHGLDEAGVDAILTNIARHAALLAPPPGPPAPDPGDQFLWDLLAHRADLLLITADKALLRDRRMRGRVLSPGDHLAAA